MASFVVDWSVPSVCTSAVKLSQKVLVLDGENPLIHTSVAQLFKEAKVGMKVVLREKSAIWNGVIESKWGKFIATFHDTSK